jgi:pyruvate kinase
MSMTNSSSARQFATHELLSERRGPATWKVPEIMATLGPTLEKEQDLCKAIEAGVRWVRLPCGYRQRPHVENARAARAAASQVGLPVQLLLDLPSSRPRTGTMQDLQLAVGDPVLFWDSEADSKTPTKNGAWPVPLPGLQELIGLLAPNNRMWFCDGRLNFLVDGFHDGFVAAHLIEGTIPLKSSNALFLPDSPSGFTAITQLDRDLLKEFAAAKVVPDWVALSLIASPQDVRDGRAEAKSASVPKSE